MAACSCWVVLRYSRRAWRCCVAPAAAPARAPASLGLSSSRSLLSDVCSRMAPRAAPRAAPATRPPAWGLVGADVAVPWDGCQPLRDDAPVSQSYWSLDCCSAVCPRAGEIIICCGGGGYGEGRRAPPPAVSARAARPAVASLLL